MPGKSISQEHSSAATGVEQPGMCTSSTSVKIDDSSNEAGTTGPGLLKEWQRNRRFPAGEERKRRGTIWRVIWSTLQQQQQQRRDPYQEDEQDQLGWPIISWGSMPHQQRYAYHQDHGTRLCSGLGWVRTFTPMRLAPNYQSNIYGLISIPCN